MCPVYCQLSVTSSHFPESWGISECIYNVYIKYRKYILQLLASGVLGLDSGSERHSQRCGRPRGREGMLLSPLRGWREQADGRREESPCLGLPLQVLKLVHFLTPARQQPLSLLFASIQLFSKPSKQVLKHLIPCVKFLLA